MIAIYIFTACAITTVILLVLANQIIRHTARILSILDCISLTLYRVEKEVLCTQRELLQLQAHIDKSSLIVSGSAPQSTDAKKVYDGTECTEIVGGEQ